MTRVAVPQSVVPQADFPERVVKGEGIHRRAYSWPPRLVVHHTEVGWNSCDDCGREHRIWIVREEVWRLLPRSWWRQRLCVGCFRAVVLLTLVRRALRSLQRSRRGRAP